MFIYILPLAIVMLIVFLFFFLWIKITNIKYKRKIGKEKKYAQITLKFAEIERDMENPTNNTRLLLYPNIKNYIGQTTYVLNNYFGNYTNIQFVSNKNKNDNLLDQELSDIINCEERNVLNLVLKTTENIDDLYKLRHPYKYFVKEVKNIFQWIKKKVKMHFLQFLLLILTLMLKFMEMKLKNARQAALKKNLEKLDKEIQDEEKQTENNPYILVEGL